MSDTRHRSGRLLVNGVALQADVSGALLWPERRLAVVADLPFAKSTAFAARGRLLPPYYTAATLDQVEGVVRRHAVERFICAWKSVVCGKGVSLCVYFVGFRFLN